MPRDVIPQEVSLNQPSLSSLAFMLRFKETWPKGFSWNFAYLLHAQSGIASEGCAMGLGTMRWGKRVTEALVRGMQPQLAQDILGCEPETGLTDYAGLHASCVTPSMVAGRLERYVAEHGDVAVPVVVMDWVRA